jgi:hypothetical protein
LCTVIGILGVYTVPIGADLYPVQFITCRRHAGRNPRRSCCPGGLGRFYPGNRGGRCCRSRSRYRRCRRGGRNGGRNRHACRYRSCRRRLTYHLQRPDQILLTKGRIGSRWSGL